MRTKAKLLKEITRAKSEAMWGDELKNMKNEQDELFRQELRGEISSEESMKKLKKVNSSKGAIKTRLLVEFISILRLSGLSEKDVKTSIIHENNHANNASMLGLSFYYVFQFLKYKRKNGALSFGGYSSIVLDTPSWWSDDKRREALTQIYSAPGKDLSPRDKYVLGITNKHESE